MQKRRLLKAKTQRVKDIATKNVEKLSVYNTVRTATDLFFSKRIHNIIIEEKDGRFTVLSITQLLDFIIEDASYDDTLAATPRIPLLTINENAKISKAVIMMEKEIDIIGVVNAKNSLYGVLTFTDVTRHLESEEVRLLSDITIASLLLKESAATAQCGERLKDKIHQMKNSPVDCVVILEGSKSRGIITKRDILRLFQKEQSLDKTVEHYMSTPLLTVKMDATVVNALDIMQTKHFRRAIVEDEQGEYRGVITQKGLVEYIFLRATKKFSNDVAYTNEMLIKALEGRTKELETYKQNLENLVEERTTELQETNLKLHDEIRQRKQAEVSLNQTKEELRELNRHLSNRVTQELENSRQKDKMIFQQSKMAAMGELISMIAHQWRQPLNGISLCVTNLKFKIGMQTLDKHFLGLKLNEMADYIQHMSKTIDDFRNFFQPDKKREIILLNELMDESLKLIMSGLKQDNINTVINSDCCIPMHSFRNELIQVFLNILKNAWDALVEKEVSEAIIDIRIVALNGISHKIIISDNAGGIPDASMEKIFDPYFSTKDEYNGTGLGLYMSKIIIEDHCNGNISVTNGSKGAIFTITLPVKKI